MLTNQRNINIDFSYFNEIVIYYVSNEANVVNCYYN